MICVHIGVKFPLEFHLSLKISTKQKVETAELHWGELAAVCPECSVHPYLVVAIFSPFFQSQNTTLWKSSKPTDTRHFPSAVWKQHKCQTSHFFGEKLKQFIYCKEEQEIQQYSLDSNTFETVKCVTTIVQFLNAHPWLVSSVSHWPHFQPKTESVGPLKEATWALFILWQITLQNFTGSNLVLWLWSYFQL